tara:strand:- start:198 stop:485 length:288 start_codon:yes stop_codon:yes gene_type:complete
MPEVHRDGDSRACGASTNAACANVFTNSKITSVDGNPNSHGGGSLNAANPNVYIGNILVVVNGNSASPDSLCPIPGGPHCAPSATSGSPDVYIGG